ncbi:MAG: hypothetical protein H6751_08095 [Candidatus Omnitrophica bacterium]|nr:hypothetical protein [Candidatus Omnitrophota bacterium]
MKIKHGIIPTVFIGADSIPEAHYKAIEAVWNHGVEKRTQYDRKDPMGDYIDPPSKEAQVLVKINDPFKDPRFPPLSFCERGKYILELLGVKDNLVIPMDEILAGIDEMNLGTQWPYTYHQRMSAYPTRTGTVNQIESVIDRISTDSNTRRAVMTTRAPVIDTQLKEDIPCLGEMHFRCLEDEDKTLVVNLTTIWRSRDLFKAWADNVIAITYFGRKIVEEIANRTGRETRLGGYTDFSNSLHIYGQDFSHLEKDEASSKKGFFDVFPNVESYVKRSWDSETARDVEVLPQMEAILYEPLWQFTDSDIQTIRGEIDFLKNGGKP